MSISSALAINFKLDNDVLTTPRSILLITDTSKLQSFANCDWLNPLFSLIVRKLAPNKIRNDLSMKYAIYKNHFIQKKQYRFIVLLIISLPLI